MPIDDLEARVKASREKLATEPTEAVKELAAVRAELLTRWSKLESTLPQPADGLHVRPVTPFYSPTLTKAGKDLLASTHTLRASVWVDQGKIDDALRELISTVGGPGAVPCTSMGEEGRDARRRGRHPHRRRSCDGPRRLQGRVHDGQDPRHQREADPHRTHDVVSRDGEAASRRLANHTVQRDRAIYRSNEVTP